MEKSTEYQIIKYGPKVLIVVLMLLFLASIYDCVGTKSTLAKLQKENSEVQARHEISLEREVLWTTQKALFEREKDSLKKANKLLTNENTKLDVDIVSLKRKNAQTKKEYANKDFKYFTDLLAERYDAPESIETVSNGVLLKNHIPRFIAEELDNLDTHINILAKIQKQLENEKEQNRNLLSITETDKKQISMLEDEKTTLKKEYKTAVDLADKNLNEAVKQSKRKNLYKWAIPAAFVGGYLLAR